MALTGDRPRDGGQRLVRPSLPFEAVGGDGDDLLDTLPFADQARTDDGYGLVGPAFVFRPVAAIQLFAKPFKLPDRLGPEPAIGAW